MKLRYYQIAIRYKNKMHDFSRLGCSSADLITLYFHYREFENAREHSVQIIFINLCQLTYSKEKNSVLLCIIPWGRKFKILLLIKFLFTL